jgi:hypothetical protein
MKGVVLYRALFILRSGKERVPAMPYSLAVHLVAGLKMHTKSSNLGATGARFIFYKNNYNILFFKYKKKSFFL